jgi:lipid-binding SYLF domain-containing protein
MKKTGIILLTVITLWICGCATAPELPEGKATLTAQVDETIAAFKAKDPSIDRFFNDSTGYAILPQVSKGAFFVGGAWGQGEVYLGGGRMIGYCSVAQATIGFSFGGEFFREIIFFRTQADMDQFLTGEYTFAAQATAVAIETGAAAKADYRNGIAVFVMADKGLMVDASIGGQKFKYLPNQ